MNQITPKKHPPGTNRRRLGVIIMLAGFLFFLLGAKPGWFGFDRSPDYIGFVQIVIFVFGLIILCVGGIISIESLWVGRRKTILADIGTRFVITGVVVAAASGMADLLGMGTRPLPNTPFFGYWQARGMIFGQIIIIIGFLLMIPFSSRRSIDKDKR